MNENDYVYILGTRFHKDDPVVRRLRQTLDLENEDAWNAALRNNDWFLVENEDGSTVWVSAEERKSHGSRLAKEAKEGKGGSGDANGKGDKDKVKEKGEEPGIGDPEDFYEWRKRRAKERGEEDKGGSDGPPGYLSDKENDSYRASILSTMIPSGSQNVKWDQIAGLHEAKGAIITAILLPNRFPKLLAGSDGLNNILLYGPPGTGKSFLAKAVATEAQATLFSVTSGNLMSKYIGENEKLVQALFQIAREKKPSVIFVDEIDSVCGKREAEGTEFLLGLKTEIMTQLQGVGSNNSGVTFLAATNLPWQLDDAIIRRFSNKIYIPLPDEKARAEMFKIGVAKKCPDLLKPKHFQQFAEVTEGFSGSDINNILNSVLNKPAKKVQRAKYWRPVMKNNKRMWTPSKEGAPGAVPMTWQDVGRDELIPPELELEDFFDTLDTAKRSVGDSHLKKYDDWTRDFGTKGD